ncbi:MAG: VanZ family protein [bacterium]
MTTLLRLLDFILRRPVVSSSLFAIWLVILHRVSNSTPAEMPQEILPQQDKILHFLFYLGGATVLAASLRLIAGMRGVRLLWVVVLCMAMLGALDEYNQQFIPGRSALNFMDWLADLAGAFGGVGLLHLILARFPEKDKSGA